MTYRSRGRSIFEVVVAVMFTGFLVGFITVLCIGNYFRAKRAQERQKQRRLAKAAAGGGTASPTTSSGGVNQGNNKSHAHKGGTGKVGAQPSIPPGYTSEGGANGYEAPHLPNGANYA